MAPAERIVSHRVSYFILERADQQVDVVIEKLEISVSSLTPPTDGIKTTTCPPTADAIEFGVRRSSMAPPG